VRNQCLNAPQVTHQLEPDGSGLGCSAYRPVLTGRELRDWLDSLVTEATVKACGVAVAMLQGQSWAPIPSNGSKVNVGTIPAVPSRSAASWPVGKARRRLMLSGWDGGPVVVRDRGATRGRTIK
jgi:hypothetical protein